MLYNSTCPGWCTQPYYTVHMQSCIQYYCTKAALKVCMCTCSDHSVPRLQHLKRSLSQYWLFISFIVCVRVCGQLYSFHEHYFFVLLHTCTHLYSCTRMNNIAVVFHTGCCKLYSQFHTVLCQPSCKCCYANLPPPLHGTRKKPGRWTQTYFLTSHC